VPDLVTHTAAAYLVSRPHRRTEFRLFFVLGTLFPDLLSRPIYIMNPGWYPYSIAAHTPFFTLVFALLVSEFFPRRQRSWIRFGFGGGILLHFILDLMQKHLTPEYYLFFPVSWKTFSFGLFWPETLLDWLPLWLAAMALIETAIVVRRRRRM